MKRKKIIIKKSLMKSITYKINDLYTFFIKKYICKQSIALLNINKSIPAVNGLLSLMTIIKTEIIILKISIKNKN